MRADLLTPTLPLQPVATRSHTPATVELEVVNNGDIIDSIGCEIPSLDRSLYEQHPLSVTLFPQERASVSLSLRFPTAYPAGFHELAIEVHGRQSETIATEHVLVEVLPVVSPKLVVTPSVLTKGSRGRFQIEVANQGNSDLQLVLRATDTNQLLKIAIEPSTLTVGPGQTGVASLIVRRRRPFFGAKIPHDLAITAEQLPDVVTADVKFQQKPRFPAGLLTALMLAAIVALWAVAVFVGVTKSMSSPPSKKTVPAAFAVGVDPATFDPAVVGADVSGAVTSATTGAPQPRITVELVDDGGHIVAAGATKKDGTFQLPAVLPGSYSVRYRAAGFVEKWYPSAATQAEGKKILVIASTPLKDVSSSLAGADGTLSGKVIAGDDNAAGVDISVEALDLVDAAPADGAAPKAPSTATGKVVATQRIQAGSVFRVAGLQTPASYRIRISAPGFQPQELQSVLDGGAVVSLNEVRLVAGSGSVSGIVVDAAGAPLGDVVVTTMLNGKPQSVTTPTAGVVGTFQLNGLISPATYVVSFAKVGFSDEVVAVRLGPGQQAGGVSVSLVSASGSLAGKVTALNGTPLGGVQISVVGGVEPVTTTSFTSGSVGSYRLAGLRLPGSHIVTFKAPGYLDQTIRIDVTRGAPDLVADVVLKPSLARITGDVRDLQGSLVGGAVIELSDGTTVRRSATASVPVTVVGTFEVDAMLPGTYTLTVRSAGYKDQTLLVTLEGGLTLTKSIQLLSAVAR